MPLHTYTGTVIKAGRMRKTVTVEVMRYTEHKKYLKAIPNRNRFHVHDEHEVSQVGDHVTILHTGQPLSNWKSFRLLEIDRRGRNISDFPVVEKGKAHVFKEIPESEYTGKEKGMGVEGSSVVKGITDSSGSGEGEQGEVRI